MSRLAPDDVDGLLPQVAWLDDDQLAVLTTAGVVVADRADLRTDDPIAWQSRPVSDVAVMRALGADRVVVSTRHGPVAVVDVGQQRARTVPVTGDVFAASSDGTVAAVTTSSTGDPEEIATLTLVDTATWKPLSRPVPLNGMQAGLAFAADGSTIAVGTATDGGEDVVQLRDGRTGELRRELTGHNGSVMGVGFTGSAHDLLWSVGRDGSAFQWDLSRQRGVVRSTEPEVVTHLADQSRDGRVGVAMTEHETTPNEAFFFDPRTGRRVSDDALPMPQCACQPWPVAMIPDGSTAVGGLDELSDPDSWEAPHTGRLALWDVPSGTLRSQVALPWTPTGLDVSTDGRHAVVNGVGGWALVDLRPVARRDDRARRADGGAGSARLGRPLTGRQSRRGGPDTRRGPGVCRVGPRATSDDPPGRGLHADRCLAG